MTFRVFVLFVVFALMWPVTADAPALAARAKAKRAGETRVITRTFSNTDEIEIPELGPIDPSSIPVDWPMLRSPRIEEIEVILHEPLFEHPDHIDMVLVAPSGVAAVLMSDAGGHQPLELDALRFDPHAPRPLPDDDTPIFDEEIPTIRPSHYEPGDLYPGIEIEQVADLAAFAGANPTGVWHLMTVSDTDTGHDGEIEDGWSLRITASGKAKRHR